MHCKMRTRTRRHAHETHRREIGGVVVKRNPALVALAIPALGAALALTMPAPKSTVPTTATGNLGVPDNLRSIVRRACRDCHSNETQWPWYSQIPPVSLLLQHHISK